MRIIAIAFLIILSMHILHQKFAYSIDLSFLDPSNSTCHDCLPEIQIRHIYTFTTQGDHNEILLECSPNNNIWYKEVLIKTNVGNVRIDSLGSCNVDHLVTATLSCGSDSVEEAAENFDHSATQIVIRKAVARVMKSKFDAKSGQLHFKELGVQDISDVLRKSTFKPLPIVVNKKSGPQLIE